MCHIHLTRNAAKTISSSIKYFLAKKKYYQIKEIVCPDQVNKSQFQNLYK
jgi:hypothetical protein